METPSRSRLTVFLVVVLGFAAIGFLRGTSTDDYDLETPLTVGEEATSPTIPRARTYAEERHATDATGAKVATACTDCHADKVSTAKAGQRTTHPTGLPVPRGADLTALTQAGGRLDTAPDGERTLVCRTCHRPHNASVDARLIVTTDSGALCLSCHVDHSPNNSRHPVNIKIDGKTRAAIEALGGDTTGGLSCLSCHDPHGSTAGSLLRTDGSGATACRACHQDKVRALGSTGHGGQSCVDCHGMHRPPALAGTGPKAGDPQDQPCVDCHAGGKGKAPQVNLGGGHPMWKTVPADMSTEEAGKLVGCNLCHIPHGTSPKLLAKGTVSDTCLTCHADKATVLNTDHDASVVGVVGKKDVCVSCHDVHGHSPRPAAPSGVNPASARCLACHDGRTTATKVGEYFHPTGLLLTGAGLPFRYSGEVPYFGPDGKRTTDRALGELACQTCHDPHRWKHGADEHPGAADGSEQNSFLRDPNGVVQFCAVCHGNDALPRFRFFHADTFRKGGEETPQ